MPRTISMTSDKINPVVFLDRDGTIIEEVGYIGIPDKIRIMPKAVDAIKTLRSIGYGIISVSNQSGVARGYFDESTVQFINKKVMELFSMRGAAIDAMYYCPHHPRYGDKNYKKDCECRKPKSGMILQAADDHQIDLSKSIMIGDKYTDVMTGKNLDMFSILLLTGFGREENEKINSTGLKPAPDLISENIYEAAEFIQKNLAYQ